MASLKRRPRSVPDPSTKARETTSPLTAEILESAFFRLREELSTLECIRRALTCEEVAGDCEAALRRLLVQMQETYNLFDQALRKAMP